MWAPQNNKVINALFLTLFLSWLIQLDEQGPVSQHFRKLFRPAKQFVKLNPLKYVFKSSQSMIISKLSDLKRFPSQDRELILVSPQIDSGEVSGLLRNGPQISINCSGLFISLLIAVSPLVCQASYCMIDWLLIVWNNFKFWMFASYSMYTPNILG